LLITEYNDRVVISQLFDSRLPFTVNTIIDHYHVILSVDQYLLEYFFLYDVQCITVPCESQSSFQNYPIVYISI